MVAELARTSTPRRLAPPAAAALVAAALVGWLGMSGGYLWTDYEYANEVPFGALVRGDLGTFLSTAPVEGPSLLLRAPFALLPSLWGGGQSAIFRAVAVPGLLAGVALGVWLWDLRGRIHGPSRWRWVVLALAAANPVTLDALRMGHPETLTGSALCCAAVLAALRDHRRAAGVLLGLAVANKLWALLAVGPVLLALDGGRRRTLGLAAVVATVPCLPFLLDPQARAAVAGAASTDAVFQPWQVWWLLGEHGHVVRGFGGVVRPDYRAAPAWIAHVSHPFVALLALPAAAAWVRLRGRRSADLLLLLAALFLARCLFDVANVSYYHLPFLFALLGWEAVRGGRPPVLTLAASGLVWLTCVRLVDVVSPDLQCLLYLAWAVPALAVLTAVALDIRPAWRIPRPVLARTTG